MNVNLSNIARAYQINQQQAVINILMRQKKSGNTQIDTFIHKKWKNHKRCRIVFSVYISKKYIYFRHTDATYQRRCVSNKKTEMYMNVPAYALQQIRFLQIDASTLSEVKACNNTIDFGQNYYFKYVSSDGKEHALFTNDKGVEVVRSERLRGAEYDAVGRNYAKFWRYMMSEDPVYYGLTWSRDEVREFMSEVGIEYGFFTVKMGDREATQYYTASETSGMIQSKERYDSKYEHITSTGYQLMNYEPGSVFRLNGKEYVLSENHTLDIPYGEDLWCLEYPLNYVCGVKID